MKMSQLFFANHHFNRDHTQLDLIDLARKACFVHQDHSGLYSWLTLGLMAEKRLEALICEEMDAIGFGQTRLSLMQDADLWRQSNRLDAYGQELMTLTSRTGRLFCLGATCEELATNIVKTHYNKTDMSLGIYQIGNKYRDEMRARGGLTRAKEFTMKDAYSFNSSQTEAAETYQRVKEAYVKIFNRLGLEVVIKSTDTGEIGGNSSEEFLVKSQLGADEVEGEQMLECGHIFDLSTRYSQAMDLKSADGSFVHMGCYGIGVSRLAMVMLERQRDQHGFWGSDAFHTFNTVISVLDMKQEALKNTGFEIYQKLKDAGVEVLIDDRAQQAGKKLADAELLGAKSRVVISKGSVANQTFELLERQTMTKHLLSQEDLIARIVEAKRK